MNRIDSTMRGRRWTLLPAAAAIVLLAALPAARAADQQTTDEEKIYALSQEVAGVRAYAEARRLLRSRAGTIRRRRADVADRADSALTRR
ncbi:MAG TPA: hypothetical protein VKX28_22915 [Xanthobacteraceae bacterium]|nr:hypothetical protein [Xanthobacteraceae bacterium]